MAARSLRVLSLCSGGGGLELGLRLALPAARVVCYVEREAFCVDHLAEAMEAGTMDPAPVWSDLTTFRGRPWCGAVDCVIGGFPCQPVSTAGKRLAQQDERWLWPHIARILREVRPWLVFLENVPGLLVRGFGDVLGSLAEFGFDAEWGVYSAAECGAPHLRKRLFVLAGQGNSMDDALCGRYGRSDEAVCAGRHSAVDASVGDTTGLQLQGQPSTGADKAGSAGVGDPDNQRQLQQGWSVAHERRWAGDADEGVADSNWPPRPDDGAGWAEVLRMQPGLAPATQSCVCRVADGSSSRMDHLRMLGNGVVPVVAAVAFMDLAMRGGVR